MAGCALIIGCVIGGIFAVACGGILIAGEAITSTVDATVNQLACAGGYVSFVESTCHRSRAIVIEATP